MAGRVAVVTGGTRGIGAAVSRMLKDKGYKVAATYAGNDDAAHKFKAETGIAVYKWDVSSFDACSAGLKQVEADLGPIDVLVNNAGITKDGLFLRMDDADFDSVISTNLKSAFVGVRRSDACRIGPSDIKGGWLRDFEAKKTARTTGVRINVPVRTELAAAIAAMKTVSTKTYLVTSKGQPFKTEESFGEWMREVYNAAGLPDVANHGLRKLAAIRLAFAGVDVWGLMKVFGWKTVAQAQVYVEQAEAMRMAGQAFDKLEAYQRGEQNGKKLSQPSAKRLGRKAK
jgi:NAD(P)-dependent dehydrogenase (short-subunit alcohol dehydrogenase family)